MDTHDRDLARAFDGQAAQFERAPAQTNPEILARLVAFAALPAVPGGARVLDAGCGPGLVSAALLDAGHRVDGIDLSAEMVRRAEARCAPYSAPGIGRARFAQASVFDALRFDGAPRPDAGAPRLDDDPPYDAAISRLVVHHVVDPLAFVARQAALVRAGGAVIVCDHTTDPDARRAAWHQTIERRRDRTHTRNLTAGQLVDLLAAAGLGDVRAEEVSFALDFDEWFDRGTPADLPEGSKEAVRALVLAGTARGYAPHREADGHIRLDCTLAFVRGVK